MVRIGTGAQNLNGEHTALLIKEGGCLPALGIDGAALRQDLEVEMRPG